MASYDGIFSLARLHTIFDFCPHCTLHFDRLAYNTTCPDRRRHPLHQSSKAILVSITHFVMENDSQSSLSAAAAAAVVPPRRSGRERRQAESVYDDATAAAAAAKRKKSRKAEASEETR